MDDTNPEATDPGDVIQTITSRAFDSLVLEVTEPVAVEFMSYSCSHCAEIEPVLQRVAEMVKSKEKIYRVNVAVDRDLANSYRIMGTPTLIMFQNGRQVGRVEGPSPTVSSILTAVTHPYRA